MIGSEPLSLNPEHQFSLDKLEHTRECFFITGKAGTGKSTLLQLFAKTTRKRIAILAPTGIAALNVEGQTIHSFFKLPPRLIFSKDIHRHKNNYVYKNLDVLIIDEISMVRADMMDNIDLFLRINRSNKDPFGGVQMIFFGDLFQLPPVVSDPYEKEYIAQTYESPYFFSAHVFSRIFVQMIELTKVYRQSERRFINLLDNIRLNEYDEFDLEELNSQYKNDVSEEAFTITLSSRNSIVNAINQRKLSQIESEPITYLAEVTGSFSPSSFPTDLALKLKTNAQVMFVRNDPEKEFVNGTIGLIKDITSEKIIVEIESREGIKKEIDVHKSTWEIIKYVSRNNKIEAEVIGTFTQYPIKLAWAITIHKSQGKTFDKVIIDIGTGAFDYGQTYVALSRCKTLDGITLKRPIRPRDIFIDPRVVDFYSNRKRLL